jgi:hypothetical protein
MPVSVSCTSTHHVKLFLIPATSDNRIERRYTAFVNSSIKVQDMWIFNPNIYISKMGNAWETVVGFNANRDLGGNGLNQLIVGLYYRNKDALIPMIGYQVDDLKFTVNYDATISSLSSLNGTRGAYEISIVKSGVFPKQCRKGGEVSYSEILKFWNWEISFGAKVLPNSKISQFQNSKILLCV